jgi:tRNA G37 N-methylase TrmD
MDTKLALKKILEELLIDEYPQVENVVITGREFTIPNSDGFGEGKHGQFNVWLVGNFEGMNNRKLEELRYATRKIGKYVLNNNERIFNVVTI